MKTLCAACSMPLEKKEDVKVAIDGDSFCTYCVDKNGKLKSTEQIFRGGVSFFMHTVEGTPLDLAERVTRRNMKTLAYWKKHPDACLDGPEASDEEYTDAMKQLGE